MLWLARLRCDLMLRDRYMASWATTTRSGWCPTWRKWGSVCCSTSRRQLFARTSASTWLALMTPTIIGWTTSKRLPPEFLLASSRSSYHILLKSIAKLPMLDLVFCSAATHMAGRSVYLAQFQLLSTRLCLAAWERVHGNTTVCRGTLLSEAAHLLS